MRAIELDNKISELMNEFKDSGLGINDFLAKKLSEARDDGQKCADEIVQTLSDIDTNYQNLQEAKKNGNREEWLRRRIDCVVQSNQSLNEDRHPIGEVLVQAAEALGAENPGSMSYDGIEASEIIRTLNEGLEVSTIKSFMEEEEA